DVVQWARAKYSAIQEVKLDLLPQAHTPLNLSRWMPPIHLQHNSSDDVHPPRRRGALVAESVHVPQRLRLMHSTVPVSHPHGCVLREASCGFRSRLRHSIIYQSTRAIHGGQLESESQASPN